MRGTIPSRSTSSIAVPSDFESSETAADAPCEFSTNVKPELGMALDASRPDSAEAWMCRRSGENFEPLNPMIISTHSRVNKAGKLLLCAESLTVKSEQDDL